VNVPVRAQPGESRHVRLIDAHGHFVERLIRFDGTRVELE
jgi:hypothetical protein